VRRLVETLELGDEVTLTLLDVATQESLGRSMNADERSRRIAAVRRLLTERSADRPDETAWSLLAACHAFAADPDDLTLLADLGAIAADAAVPLLATAAPSLLGRERLEERADPRGWMIPDPAIAEQWSDLRRSPVARWIGLALPRVLLRLPYGAATEAIESFGFEEVAGEHESLLWGHPGLACVEAIARSSMVATTARVRWTLTSRSPTCRPMSRRSTVKAPDARR
jgi:type VI secretion system protein ImpC